LIKQGQKGELYARLTSARSCDEPIDF